MSKRGSGRKLLRASPVPPVEHSLIGVVHAPAREPVVLVLDLLKAAR